MPATDIESYVDLTLNLVFSPIYLVYNKPDEVLSYSKSSNEARLTPTSQDDKVKIDMIRQNKVSIFFSIVCTSKQSIFYY